MESGRLKAFPIVSAEEAKSVPYPYVYVNNDGTVRELHLSEHIELEKSYSPLDGGAPYVKNTYDQKDGMKRMQGPCPRSRIPKNIHILPAPQEDPVLAAKKKAAAFNIEYAKKHGFEYVENADGTVTIVRPKLQDK